MTRQEFRKNLLDKIIAIYGMKHEITIAIAEMCERYPLNEIYDKTLAILVECHEMYPMLEKNE